MIDMIKLIALLGNKGDMYKESRHNSGWLFGDYLDPELKEGPFNEKFHGLWKKVNIEGNPIYFIKPLTYMNESGKSIQAIKSYFSVEDNQLLVVHDDLELPFLTAKIQRGGPLAGHNGLRSIAKMTNSTSFLRLRIGIGRPKVGSVSSYVLSRFSKEEEPMLALFFENIATTLRSYLAQGAPVEQLPITVKIGS